MKLLPTGSKSDENYCKNHGPQSLILLHAMEIRCFSFHEEKVGQAHWQKGKFMIDFSY